MLVSSEGRVRVRLLMVLLSNGDHMGASGSKAMENGAQLILLKPKLIGSCFSEIKHVKALGTKGISLQMVWSTLSMFAVS